MKKLKVILACAVLLVVALHPAVAFHYCGNSLSDVSLTGHAACPCGMALQHDDASGVALDMNCCRTTSLQLSAGDYLRHTTASVPQPSVKSIQTAIPQFVGMALIFCPTAEVRSPRGAPPDPPLPPWGRTILQRDCSLLI